MNARKMMAFTALAVTVGLTIAGCSNPGGSDVGAPTETPTEAAYDFGTPNTATGDPIVFGVLNLETGPVTFPETVQAEQAAVDYVNEYLGGIGGRPIKLATCATDGQPATSAKCANQLLDENPVAIIGATDTGSPGAIEVWRRAGLAYIGGVPFTPVEQNYENAVIFSSASVGDPAAASVYAAQQLGAKTAAVIYTSDTQGTASAQGYIIPTMKAAGVKQVTEVTIPPTSSDVASAVATAVAANPDVIYLVTPAACPNVLSSLLQLGNQAAVFGIDPCTSPAAIAGSGGGAEGMYFASPTVSPFGPDPDAQLFMAALGKYAPADIPIDSLTAVGFQTIINLQAALADFDAADLTTEKILAAFRTGSDVPNFMGHPYTCDGKQLNGASAVCDSNQRINQIKDGHPVEILDEWISAGDYYQPAPH